jgi:hypothetical protein
MTFHFHRVRREASVQVVSSLGSGRGKVVVGEEEGGECGGEEEGGKEGWLGGVVVMAVAMGRVGGEWRGLKGTNGDGWKGRGAYSSSSSPTSSLPPLPSPSSSSSYFLSPAPRASHPSQNTVCLLCLSALGTGARTRASPVQTWWVVVRQEGVSKGVGAVVVLVLFRGGSLRVRKGCGREKG